jgi:hypothetical protein
VVLNFEISSCIKWVPITKECVAELGDTRLHPRSPPTHSPLLPALTLNAGEHEVSGG